MAIHIEVPTQLTHSSFSVAQAVTTNSNTASFDTKDYVGKLAVNVNAGNGVNAIFALYLQSSADTNQLNATNLNISIVNTTANNAQFSTLSVDKRVCKRYLFAVWTITGSSATQPFALDVIGLKQVQQ